MSINSEKDEIELVVNRLLDNLSTTISSQSGRAGIGLRNQIGKVRAGYDLMLRDGTFGTELYACFTSAVSANVKLLDMANVHVGLFAEDPVGDISKAIVQAAVGFCMSAESKIVITLDFVSRDDVDAMIDKMKATFDTARDLVADANDSTLYQKMTALAGSVTNHLANVARPLPRMITFNLAQSFPALTASQRVYYDASRWEELVHENKTIHPAFVQNEIRGLSA